MDNTMTNFCGWSATITSMMLNILTIQGIELVNNGYTIILSTMSAIYLYYKIKNEKRKHDEED
jgi:hypothetical protein